jgi:uncharacterized membrane protein HdeD (DUF308 family)
VVAAEASRRDAEGNPDGFLSLLVVSLPHAVTDAMVSAIGAYALGFGVLVSIAAFNNASRAAAPAVSRWP